MQGTTIPAGSRLQCLASLLDSRTIVILAQVSPPQYPDNQNDDEHDCARYHDSVFALGHVLSPPVLVVIGMLLRLPMPHNLTPIRSIYVYLLVSTLCAQGSGLFH